MPNITWGQERATAIVGADEADARARGRYARNRKMLPASERSRNAAQYDTVHLVVDLLLEAVGGSQVTAVERVKKVWNLPLLDEMPRGIAGLVDRPQREFLAGLTFGQSLVAIIESWVRRDVTKEMVTSFTMIEVSHRGDYARLNTSGMGLRFSNPSTDQADPVWRGLHGYKLVTLLIPPLAEIVSDSRAEAARRGITIPTEDTYQALGSNPLPADFWSARLRQRSLPLDPPVSAAGSQNEASEDEKADTPARASTSSEPLSSHESRTDADTRNANSSRHNADVSARACPSSSGNHPRTRRAHRYDAQVSSPHHALF